jgi:hypothetical protein
MKFSLYYENFIRIFTELKKVAFCLGIFLKLKQTFQNRNSVTLYAISLFTFLMYSGYFMHFRLSNKNKSNKIIVASPKSSSKKINGEDCTNW